MASDDILTRPAPPADARLRYGTDEWQFGDLRLPSGAGPHPLVIGIHGGYWRARYGLEHFGHACAALTDAGYATWNIEYRRFGNAGGGWPGTLRDVALATDYARTLAESYSLDLSRVVTVGHSAGGHLACWLAGRRRVAAESAVYTTDPLALRGAVALAGVLDLRRAWELRLSEGVVSNFLGGTPEEYPDRYDAASPFALLPLGVGQTLVHGTADEDVPYRMSEEYATRARESGDTVGLVTLPNAGHFELIDPLAKEWATVVEAVRRMVG